VNWDKQLDIVKQTQVSFDHPLFLQKIFSLVAKTREQENVKEADNLKRTCVEEFDQISIAIDKAGTQESSSVRNVLRTRRLANLLINEAGDLNSAALPKVIKCLKNNLYSLGQNRQYDAKGQQQILAVLELLNGNKELVRLLKKISKPFSHQHGEQIIRETLQLPDSTKITDAHARRAALSAWMCTLRQSVGSCFATAPAIIVHDEQPELFLTDLNDILSTGRLKRTYGGIEYSVPLSASWGIGDLRKQFVLPREIDRSALQIWQSPSVVHAFQAVNLVAENWPQEQKLEQVKQLIGEVLSSWEGHEPFVLTSTEEIFERVLMRRLAITKSDLEDYENRPKFMLFSSLVTQMPKSSKDYRSKGDSCAGFLVEIELMKNVFKSYADNALLKSWEFTLASYAESKANFTRWNLYTSLGLNPEDKGGIGNCLYVIIKAKLDECNAEVQELQIQYEQMYTQVKFLGDRIKRASSESEAQWMKIDYQAKMNEFYSLQEMRDQTHSKASRYAGMYDLLIEFFDKKFPEYFQEVYDADMHEVRVGPYDDSPAGFRLLFRQVRSLTTPGVPIHNATQFVEALVSFFNSVENEIVSDPRLLGMEKDLSDIITAVVTHLRTNEFIETAFYRIAAAHHAPLVKNPLENLDKIDKKPWAYTSGGTMGTLVSCYFKREQAPTEVNRWVDNETELGVFLLDTLKQIPHAMLKEYAESPKKSLLMHSPTHAFLLKPGNFCFKEGWQSEMFTYTWLRDQVIHPMKKFVDEIILDREMMHHLLGKIKTLIPEDFQPHFSNVFSHLTGKMSPADFRNHLLKTLASDRGFRFSGGQLPDEIDQVLFSSLPLFPSYELRERIGRVAAFLPGIKPEGAEQLLDLFDQISGAVSISRMVSAQELKEMVLVLICLSQMTTTTSVDFHLHIMNAMRKLGFAMPTPFIFADTNWVRDEFGFVVNPGTEKFELWRMDYTASTGSAMSGWKKWLDGSRKDPTWGVYNRPYEYTARG